MKYKLRRLIRRFELIHIPFIRRKWENWKVENNNPFPPSVVISSETTAVVDGFPRSGNSFFVALLSVSQPSSLVMSHHLHSAAHIKAGVRKGVPVVVIVREPRDAVLAYQAYDKLVPLSECLRDWISFYRQILSLPQKSFALARFERFIKDGNHVVDDVNAVFPDFLRKFDHETQQVRAKEYLENVSQKAFGKPHQSQPSGERNAYKKKIESQLEHPKLKRLLRQAQEIYERLVVSVG